MVGFDSVVTFLTNTVASVLLLLTVFAGLAGGERLAARWRGRKRRTRERELRAAGVDPDTVDALGPYLDYEVKHHSALKPLLGGAAATVLFYLTTNASNATFLATGYAATGVVFVALAAVELRRYRRARRLRRAVDRDPEGVAAGEERFPYVRDV